MTATRTIQEQPSADRKLSTTFIASKIDGPLIPSVLDEEVYFNALKDRYDEIKEDTPRGNVYSKAELKKHDLRTVMRAFQVMARRKEEPKKSQENDFDIAGCHKWTDVVQTLEVAKSQYEIRHKGKTLKAIDNFFSSVGDSGATFQAWLSLLPDGDYSSIICGSFKLVIKAVVGFSKVRDMVFANLAEIPLALDAARDYLKMNNIYQSLKLHQAFSKLCAAILSAFEDMLRWLGENRWKHAAKAFFASDGYEADLKAKVNNVKQQSELVRKEAEVCSQILLGNVDQKLSKHIVQFDGMKLTVEGVRAGVERLSPVMEKIVSNQSKQGEGITRIEDRLNAFYRFLQDDLMTVLQPITEGLKKKARKSKGSNILTARTLLKYLNSDLPSAKADVTHALEYGRASEGPVEERANTFMSHSRLRSWLTASTSEFLLVNGNAEDNTKMSAMSFSCGMLVTSLAKFGGAIPLTFFCGRHCQKQRYDDPEPNAALMMASLLSQLLAGHAWDGSEEEDAFDFNALFKNGNYTVTDIKELYLEALCAMFSDLVQSLPNDQILFVLIDGINFFEYASRKEGTLFAVQQLFQLVQSKDLKAVCKILVTSAARSLHLGKTLLSNVTMNVDRELEREDQGFNLNRRLLEDGEEMKKRGKLLRLSSHPDELDEDEDSNSTSSEIEEAEQVDDDESNDEGVCNSDEESDE